MSHGPVGPDAFPCASLRDPGRGEPARRPSAAQPPHARLRRTLHAIAGNGSDDSHEPATVERGFPSAVPAAPPSQVGMLSNAGRSSDSQARPADTFSRTLPPGGRARNGSIAAGLFPDRRSTDWNRLDTAAGPSRNRTGVPCLPDESSCRRRATRFEGECRGLLPAVKPPRARTTQSENFTPPDRGLSNPAGRARDGPESVAVARHRAAQIAHARPTAIPTQCAP